ncbi:MAG: hypothetical protein LBT76_03740 [Tannerella sp.]|jgi:hypothetical protein|nr:hypothetical protein [Tannerella sp.]
MDKIEIISSIIAACATVLTGVYFIVKKLVSAGMNKEKVQRMEGRVSAYGAKQNECGERFHANEKAVSSLQNMESRVDTCEARQEKREERVYSLEKIAAETTQNLALMRSDFTVMRSDLAVMRSDFRNLEKNVDGMRDILSEISAWIMKKDTEMIPSLSARHSPRTLTQTGTGLLNMSGGKECIDGNLAFSFPK